MSRFQVDVADLRVVSVGTGSHRAEFSRSWASNREPSRWGLLSGWSGPRFVDLILGLQSDAATNMTELLLPEDSLLRIDFESDRKLSMDDPRRMDDWIRRADDVFARRSEEIRGFLT